jgi:hypothetical protein
MNIPRRPSPEVTTTPVLAATATGESGTDHRPSGTQPTPPTPAGVSVVSSRVSYPWQWPGALGGPIMHDYPTPPWPHLTRIGAADHPDEPGERPYNRMAFVFDTTFPSYWFQYTDELINDRTGEVIPLEGRSVLRIVFLEAQAHVSGSTQSSITSQPPCDLGMARMVDYAQAGDFECTVTYGIGIDWPIARSNPEIPVRVYEVHRSTAAGQHEYVVAFDVDAR